MGEFFRRILYLLSRRRRDRELQKEMAFHREMLTQNGHTNFGHALLLREDSREAWGWMWLDRLQQDLAYAVRILRRAPSFTFAAITILALGIGVNLSAFHIFNLVALKPLPVRDPDTIVKFYRSTPQMTSTNVPYPAVEFYREHNTVLSAVMAETRMEVTFGKESNERVRATFVTPNYFLELGASAAYGRLLVPGTDDAKSAELVAVLSYGFWERQFGGDPSIVGKVVHLNRKPVLVAGVAPYDFTGLFAQTVDVWLPVTQQPRIVDGSRLLHEPTVDTMSLSGRLKPGVTPEQAEEALKPLVAEMRRHYPGHFLENEKLAAEPGARISDLSKAPRAVLLMIALLVLLILVVACANLGNLMLARSVAREREISIRMALGAGRVRIARQLFTESVLLALAGTAAGLLLSAFIARILLVLTEAPVYLHVSVDHRVALVALVLALFAAVCFGLPPALQATRHGHRRHGFRRLLIVVQVGASCVLLIISGLLVRSYQRTVGLHPGFEYKHVISLDPGLASHGYTDASAATFLQELQARLQRMSGVESVALCSIPPLGNRVATYSDDQPAPYQAYGNDVDSQFFKTMSIPILRGRNFTADDKKGVIVSESLARILWPGQDPVGQLLTRSYGEVIGVVGRARTVVISDGNAHEIYYPIRRASSMSWVLIVRTRGAPEASLETLRVAAQTTDSRLLPQITLLKDSYTQRMQSAGRGAQVISAMGLLAALLAASGVYGLVCYAVSQRQKDIGIRMALGAGRNEILSLILRQFYVPVSCGIMAGIAVAAGVSVALRSLLFGMSHLDPISYVAAIAFFVLLTTAAALIPARRALHVQPNEVLRHEAS